MATKIEGTRSRAPAPARWNPLRGNTDNAQRSGGTRIRSPSIRQVLPLPLRGVLHAERLATTF
jgi:hypothetical protein